MNTKRIAVTGATGNIGTSVVSALAEDSRVGSILGVARRKPRWTCPKLQMVTADIAEDPLEGLFDGCDAVIHLAWLLQPTHNPAVTWRTNVLGGKRVFEAAAGAGVPALVYGSSVGAYSPGIDDLPVTENWSTDGWPGAAYTREKAYMERLLDIFAAEHPKLRVARLRPGFVFKRESASSQRRLFAGPLLPNALLRPGLIPFVPNLPGVRAQVVHSFDVARAYVAVTLSEAEGAFNVATEPPVTSEMIAELLRARRFGLPTKAARTALAAAWRLHAVPASPGLFDALCRLPVMDTTRIREELGWQPGYTAMETMRELFDGLRDGAGFATPPLRPRVPGGRLGELRTGVGQRS
ncbi:NAD-dependent epimerase/dehydratase family protein [Stackebrandtia nassauensis]|uniref:NAD-dependent epimerase/dehydratase n=1 Tax=Stackebrandtia nassauensis (strain DSM 44728 / CIP 108903 / NRRL B-16338 / NBRC 102104 / LLR-40K-21) TaxID=446470 RepID=D3Q876_STANL|nr:NAD-dependent epimerase/dehydratase family protein [Stackebrandtia nassauensis]ADD42450.1 NAD-dependent epimerase/dehydratase [Stackebrandtia nassauensis DSM 44728]